jgi:hypothetical protein
MRVLAHQKLGVLVLVIGLGAARGLLAGKPSNVEVIQTPNGGIQPQAISDEQGTIHLIYFQGDPANGDLYYTRREAGKAFSLPIRVNSQRGSAIAVGTIRAGQIALGRNGLVHVAWNGSGRALPKPPLGGSPMLYARTTGEGQSFEPQRNLMTSTKDLDGGGTVAADQQGNVYVA